MNLLKLLNQSNYNFFFLVVNPFLDIKLPQLKNFYHIRSQSAKNSGQLLAQPSSARYINKICQQNNRQPAIVFFKPSAKIDFLCQKHGWLKIGNSASLSRPLEDKIKFFRLCQKHRLPQIPQFIDPFNQNTYQKYQQRFKHLVIQTKFGWAGKSSHLSKQWTDISSKIPLNTTVKYSPYLKNCDTLINNCCLTNRGLIQSPPARQISGIKSLSQNPLATIGRQWPCQASADIKNQVKKISQQFGRILAAKNYKGFFGLDFLVSPKQVYLQECNPRLTASFAFYTQIEQKNNITPLFYLHLATFLNLDQNINLIRQQTRFDHPSLIGYQLNQKNQQGNTIRQIDRFQLSLLNRQTIESLFQNAPSKKK